MLSCRAVIRCVARVAFFAVVLFAVMCIRFSVEEAMEMGIMGRSCGTCYLGVNAYVLSEVSTYEDVVIYVGNTFWFII